MAPYELTAALGSGEVPTHAPVWDEPPRIGRLSVTWVFALVLIAAIVTLTWITHIRNEAAQDATPPPTPAIVTPTVEPGP